MITMKHMKRAVAGIVTAVAFATVASAATFSVVGGTATTLPTDFDAALLAGPAPLPSVGDPITSFSGASPFGGGQGLHISANSQLTFTYLGKEATASNSASQFSMGSSLLSTTGSNRGQSVTAGQSGPGFVNFVFSTMEGMFEDINGNGTTMEALSISNGGATGFSGLHIAFGMVFNNGRSVLAFFGDGRGDADYDDMVVRIDAVPLPATALMLLGAMGGLGALRLRKKRAVA